MGPRKKPTNLRNYGAVSQAGKGAELHDIGGGKWIIAYHVLLLSRQLVPSSVLASPLNLSGVETLSYVGGEPVLGSDKVAELLSASRAAALPPRLLLLLGFLFLTHLCVRIPVGVDVADQAVRKIAESVTSAMCVGGVPRHAGTSETRGAWEPEDTTEEGPPHSRSVLVGVGTGATSLGGCNVYVRILVLCFWEELSGLEVFLVVLARGGVPVLAALHFVEVWCQRQPKALQASCSGVQQDQGGGGGLGSGVGEERRELERPKGNGDRGWD